MKEIKTIIEAYDKIDRKSIKAALATVVNVEGSSYRRTGARMLVMDNGVWIGGISGGCLEGDALRNARISIINSKSTLITYDTTEDDPYQIGVGLGCNGIIEVLITPLDFENKNNPVEILKTCIRSGRRTNVLLTVIGIEGNWKIRTGDTICYENQETLSIFENKEFESQLFEKLNQQSTEGKSTVEHFELADGKKISLFVEIIMPEIHVILMGHQYDIFPMTMISKEIGWKVTVAANPLKINPSIKNLADEILNVDQLDETRVDDYTAIILMSHDYKTDKSNLVKALQSPTRYIGLLGPRVRAEKIFAELEKEGVVISDKDHKRIFAPGGLDIGALSPEEIALSLVGEIRAVFSERHGGFLKLRKTTIHERNRV